MCGIAILGCHRNAVLPAFLGVIHSGLDSDFELFRSIRREDESRLCVTTLAAKIIITLLPPFSLCFCGQGGVVRIGVVGSYNSGGVYACTVWRGKLSAGCVVNNGYRGFGKLWSLCESPCRAEAEHARAHDQDGGRRVGLHWLRLRALTMEFVGSSLLPIE